MARSYVKFRQELGKASLVGVVTATFSTMAAQFLTDDGIPAIGFAVMAVVAVFFLVVAAICLSEKEVQGTSKWQSIKVKKDTTVHVKVEKDDN